MLKNVFTKNIYKNKNFQSWKRNIYNKKGFY